MLYNQVYLKMDITPCLTKKIIKYAENTRQDFIGGKKILCLFHYKGPIYHNYSSFSYAKIHLKL